MAAAAFAQGIGPSDEHPESVNVGEFFEYHGNERITAKEYIDGAYRNYYYSDEDDWTIPEEYRFHHDYVLTDAHFLPSPARKDALEQYDYDESATTAIKQQLLEKRAVMISIRADTSTPETMAGKDRKYISDRWAHYTWDDSSSDHSVTIIGWDDHYPKENFLAEHQPPADGAWLAKNSWGSAEEAFPCYALGNWGIENENGQHTGYFWISYYDHSLSEPISLELETASPAQSIDQHDYFPIQAPNSQTYDEPVSMANVFRADHSKTLRTISCTTASANTSVHYLVYLLRDDYQTPEDGLMVAEGLATFGSAGFHRVPVSEIRVHKDQYYSVVVTLTNQEGTYDIIMPSTRGLSGENNQITIVNERESYFHQGGQWQDYKSVVDALKSELASSGEDDFINLSYDNFPIKVYSDRAAEDVKLKVKHGDTPLCMLEGYNTNLYTLQFIGSSTLDIGNPSIVWQTLPGSEDIVEIETRDQGAKLAFTAKAPGIAMFSVAAEGIGTTVFPVVVQQGRLDMAIALASEMPYTGQEITPAVIVYSDVGPILKEGIHYQLSYYDNIRCGLARIEATGIGTCKDPDAEPVADYFPIVPNAPEILSLSAQSSEIHLSVKDLSDTGADGYEVQYRLKGKDEWATASFGIGQTDLAVSSLTAGEYEVQVRAFVDNTDVSAPDVYRTVAYGSYGDIRTITVP